MSSDTTELRTNIWKLYVLSALATLGFAISIFIPFQEQNGLSLRQAFLLQAAYSLVLVIMEIPSGYLSDRWGRRNTITTGSAALFLGMLTYAVMHDFWGFLVAESLLAAGISFHSGSIEAMTYDTLLALKEERRYLKVNGMQGFLALGSKSLSALFVGFLAVVSLRLPFWVDAGMFGFATLISALLTEPSRHMLRETQHLKAMWRIATHALVRNVPLRGILILSAVVAAIDVQIFWFLQPFQTSIDFPLRAFGVTNAVMCLFGALAYKEAHRFGPSTPLGTGKRVERMGMLWLIAGAISLLCFGIGSVISLWGLLFFVAEGVLFGLFDPVSSNLINRVTTSDVRATVLSLKSFSSRILFAMMSPFLGWLADVFSLRIAIFASGTIGVATLLVIWLSMRRVQTEKKLMR